MKKSILIAGAALALGGVALVGQEMVANKVEEDLNAFFIDSGLNAFLQYSGVNYSVISGTLYVDDITLSTARGDVTIDQLRVKGWRDTSSLPDSLSIELDGVNDFLPSIMNGIDGPDGDVGKGSLFNSAMYGFPRSTDYMLSYEYNKNGHGLHIKFDVNRHDQYEFGFESDLSNIRQIDVENSRRFLEDFQITAKVASFDRRNLNDGVDWFVSVVNKMPITRDREVRSWIRNLSDNIHCSDGSMYFRDKGYLAAAENKGKSAHIVFPDESIKSIEVESQSQKYLGRVARRLDRGDLNSIEQKALLKFKDRFESFLQGGKTMSMNINLRNPINIDDFLGDLKRRPLKLIGQGNVEISVN